MTQLFDVGFDDTFFTADEPGLELTPDECAALTQRMKAQAEANRHRKAAA